MKTHLLTFSAIVALWQPVYGDAVDDLAALLSQRDCFAATFKQTLSDDQGVLMQQSSGTVQAARPNKLRWLISAPDTQVIVSDGQTLWRYEADLEQLIVSSFDAQGAGIPAKLLSGDIEALAQYTVTVEGHNYRLMARDESNLFGQMTLSFADTRLAKIDIVDNFEQRTLIVFGDTELDCGDDSLFSFTPPPGIDVIYE